MNPRRWPVRWRIAAVSASLTLLILICFALVVGRLATNRIHNDFEDELVGVASQLRLNLQVGRAPGEDVVVRGPKLEQMAMTGDAAIRISDADGRALEGPYGPAETPGAPWLGDPTSGGVHQMGDFDVVSLPLELNSLGGSSYIQYARRRDSLDATVSRLWLFLAGGVSGGTILALLAGVAVAGRAMKPVSSLTAAARTIGTTRDPSRRIPKPDTEDEVAELAQTLDQMLRELDAARAETQQMIDVQREFVADASHELRTPLTSILANLELLDAGMADRDATSDEREMVAGALGSSRRMHRLVSDLLLLARADAGRLGARRVCDLSELARTVLAEVRPISHEHMLVANLPTPVDVEGNPDDLHRLLLNLIENAVRHTPAVSRVEISVSELDQAAEIVVEDDGPGLPDEVDEAIFSRFVRAGDPADKSSNSGTGLGLAIVRAVATAHGGTVMAGRSQTGGARFVVRLPLVSSGQPQTRGNPR